MVGGYLAGNNTGNDTGIVLNYTKSLSLCQEPSAEQTTLSARIANWECVCCPSSCLPVLDRCPPDYVIPNVVRDLVPRPTTAVHCAERDSSSCGFRMTGWVHACRRPIDYPATPLALQSAHSAIPNYVIPNVVRDLVFAQPRSHKAENEIPRLTATNDILLLEPSSRGRFLLPMTLDVISVCAAQGRGLLGMTVNCCRYGSD